MFPHCFLSRAAQIARERLRLVLYSDRGEVSKEVQQKLRDNIVMAVSRYVEVEPRESIRLNVSMDPDIGTLYSVVVPVRRVRPEYQESWFEAGFSNRVWTDENIWGENGGDILQMKPSIRLETAIVDEQSGTEAP